MGDAHDAGVGFIDAAADLLLGSRCPGCGDPGLGVCRGCTVALRGREPHRVRRAGLHVDVVAAAPYRPLLSHIIPSFKDDGAWGLGPFLSLLLATAITHLEPPPQALVVPVATSPSSVRRRGFDHGLHLARGAARRLGQEHRRLLRRSRGGLAQRGLGRLARLELTSETFRARFTDRPVILVDDVVTTGATLNGACEALRRCGVHVWGAAVIADANTVVS